MVLRSTIQKKNTNRTVVMRKRRHFRIRQRIFGDSAVPRLSIYKSNRHILVQLIDDNKHETIISASSMELNNITNKKEKAVETGKLLLERINKIGIKKLKVDRGGYKYCGIIASLVDTLRNGDINI